jgi:Ca2+-binding EF-hand superfamily protein
MTQMTQAEMVDELFDIYDANEDGVISRGEFVGLIECLLQEKGVHVSSDIFKKFDTNQDGMISKSELLVLVDDMLI